MFKKFAVMLCIVAFSLSAISCAKVGETTGKVVKEVKEMPGEFKDGYKKGRTSEEDNI